MCDSYPCQIQVSTLFRLCNIVLMDAYAANDKSNGFPGMCKIII